MDNILKGLLLLLAVDFTHSIEFNIHKSTDEAVIQSPVNLPINTVVRFRCNYQDVIPEIEEPASIFYLVEITSPNPSSAVPISVASCLLISTTPNPKITIGSPIETAYKNMSLCNKKQMYFDVTIDASLPVEYSCVVKKQAVSIIYPLPPPVFLRSHTPITPEDITLTFQPAGIIKEGDMIYFTCTCSAKPPPKLKFKINSERADERNYTLTPTDITADTPTGDSTAKLNLTAIGSIKSVSCYPFEHPSGSEAVFSKNMNIYYGPAADLPELPITHNLRDGEIKPLNATVDAYPLDKVTYSWHKEESAGDPSFANTAVVPVPSNDINEINAGEEATLVYWCKIVNEGNNNKEAIRKFKLTITKPVEPIDDNKANTGDKPSDNNTGLIVGCVVGGVVLLVIIILVVIFVKRRQTRTPEKGKKAAAARADSQQDSQPYNNSTSTNSLHRGDRGSLGYHDNPTLPVEYRNSQGNPEVYTGIDDKPRSRKPIALDDLGADALDGGPPMYGEAPPAYTNTMTSYNSSRPIYPQHQDNYYNANPPYSPSYGGSSYGAAC